MIKMRMVDESLKVILVDTSLSVAEVLEIAAKKWNLKNYEEYALQEALRPDVWLKSEKSLPEQIMTMDQELKLKKRFFLSDQTANLDDPLQIHFFYCQVSLLFVIWV